MYNVVPAINNFFFVGVPKEEHLLLLWICVCVGFADYRASVLYYQSTNFNVFLRK